MSFGTFASKFGGEPKVSMDLGIEAGLPFGTDDFALPDVGDSVPFPNPDEPVEPDVMPPLVPSEPAVLPDIPWSLVIPAAIIGVVAVGAAWYLNDKKMPEISL